MTKQTRRNENSQSDASQGDTSQRDTSQGENQGLTAEEAMNIVLEAERKAREAVEQCQAQADGILQEARQKSQRIGKRVDDRMTRIHQRITRAVADQVKQLDAEEQELAKQDYLYRIEEDVVEKVVEQIAGLLTAPESKPDE